MKLQPISQYSFIKNNCQSAHFCGKPVFLPSFETQNILIKKLQSENIELPENILRRILHSKNSDKGIAFDLCRDKDFPKELIPNILEQSEPWKFELIRKLAFDKKLNFQYKEDIAQILENYAETTEYIIYNIIEKGMYDKKRWLKDITTNCWKWICDKDISQKDILQIPKEQMSCLRFYAETTSQNIISEHLNFVNKAVRKADKIGSSTEDIENQMFSRRTIKSLDMLGTGNLIAALDELKLDKFNEFCSEISNMRFSEEAFELLESKINPTNTKKYRTLQKELTELKKSLPLSNNKKELIYQINNKTSEIRNFVAQKIDLSPQEIVSKLWILAAVSDGHADKKIIELIKSSSPENDLAWNSAIDKKIYEKMNMPYDENLSNKLNLVKCDYINKLFLSNQRFFANLKGLISSIASKPEASIEEALDSLVENRITKKQFRRKGIDYEKWTKVDADSFVKIKDFTIRKADMYDVKYALALGNHAGCCNALGKRNKEWTAPNYIKYKCFSAIEVLDKDKPIGNSMIYLANVDGKLALVIDNIELRKEYHENTDILDGIIQYAKQLCKEIGREDIKIYAGPNRHKTNMTGFAKKSHTMDILGNTGNDAVFLDFDVFNVHQIDSYTINTTELYEIR